MVAWSRITCFWPGLPRLWWQGDGMALLGALGFAAVVNLGLVSSLVWSASLPTWLLVAGWFALGAIWLGYAVHGWRLIPVLRGADAGPAGESLFVRAQAEYLNRHWLEAEELLHELLTEREQDAEARLMLATLYRHTGRTAEAADCLRRLERMDAGQRWRVEIARERRLLETEGTPTETETAGRHAPAGEETSEVAGGTPVEIG